MGAKIVIALGRPSGRARAPTCRPACRRVAAGRPGDNLAGRPTLARSSARPSEHQVSPPAAPVGDAAAGRAGRGGQPSRSAQPAPGEPTSRHNRRPTDPESRARPGPRVRSLQANDFSGPLRASGRRSSGSYLAAPPAASTCCRLVVEPARRRRRRSRVGRAARAISSSFFGRPTGSAAAFPLAPLSRLSDGMNWPAQLSTGAIAACT